MTRSAAAAAAGLALALYTGWETFLWPCLDGITALVKLAVVFLIATGCGRVGLRRLGLSDISDSQKTLLGATLGLGMLSLAVFGLAAAGALNEWSLAGLLAVLWLVGVTETRAILESLTANRNILVERPWAAAAIALGLLLALAPTWAPPHQYDSLVYHLALAQDYVRAHALSAPPRLMYAYFPQNGEMLFTLALLMRSDLLAQMLMWLCLALSAWWLFELGKREAPLSGVLLGCLFLVTQTSAMLLAGTSYVESLVMLWTTAAVLCFLRWRQLDSAWSGQRSWLILSALFTGLALGAKYTSGITAALLAAALAWRLLRGEAAVRRERAVDLLLYVALTGLVFSPWLLRNELTVGNPLFPFFYKLFPATGTGWSAQTAQRYFEVLTEYGHRGRFLSDVAELPAKLLTDDPRFGGGMDALGRLGWELVFGCLPLAFWQLWRNGFWRALLLFVTAFTAVWFFTGVVLRFLTMILPLLCLLAGAAVAKLWAEASGAVRGVMAAALSVLTVAHVFLFLHVSALFGIAGVITGTESRAEFLSRRLDYYPCARFASEHLDKNVKILIVGEQRAYYLDRDHVASTVNAPNDYIGWANDAPSPTALGAKLHGEGFTHVLFVPREWARLGAGLGELSQKGLENWTRLEPGVLSAVFQSRGCSLYAVRPAS